MTLCTLTPEIEAFLTKYDADALAAKNANTFGAKTISASRTEAPVEVEVDDTDDARRSSLDLIGSFDHVEQATTVGDEVRFVAPSYLTRVPLRYDELCRLLYRLSGSGESNEVIAKALGFDADDVKRAVAHWKRHLNRKKDRAPRTRR